MCLRTGAMAHQCRKASIPRLPWLDNLPLSARHCSSGDMTAACHWRPATAILDGSRKPLDCLDCYSTQRIIDIWMLLCQDMLNIVLHQVLLPEYANGCCTTCLSLVNLLSALPTNKTRDDILTRCSMPTDIVAVHSEHGTDTNQLIQSTCTRTTGLDDRCIASGDLVLLYWLLIQ